MRFSRGFSLIEVLVAIGIFGSATLLFAVVASQSSQSAVLTAQTLEAQRRAREGVEVVRILRDQSWSSVAAGTYGLVLSASQWNFSGASDTEGPYTRSVQIVDRDPNHKDVTIQVAWQFPQGQSHTATLVSQLTNWRTPATQANQLTLDLTNVSISGSGNNEVRSIVFRNTGSSSIILSTFQWGWTNSKNVQILRINNNGNNQLVWDQNGPGTPSGSQGSGAVLDSVDVTILAGQSATLTQMKFSGSMEGAVLSVTIGLGDGSFKTFTNITPSR